MTVNRRRRKAHDAWGNKHGNRCGSIIYLQFLIGDCSDVVNGAWDRIDVTKAIDASGTQYVIGKYSVERIRR